MRAGAAFVALPAALAGCDRSAAPPGELSADEERDLNAAAEMLDANSVSSDVLTNQG